MNLFQCYKKLKECGVIALNKRNGDYILPLNRRSLFPLVDDKTLTKKLALGAGLNVPKLYGILNTQYELRHLDSILEGHESFAIKPSRGSGGFSASGKRPIIEDSSRLPNPEHLPDSDRPPGSDHLPGSARLPDFARPPDSGRSAARVS